MSVLTDLLATLDRWEEWKKMREAPARVDALEKEIAELKDRLKRAPGEACPGCGALTYRVEKAVPRTSGSFGGMGVRDFHYKCSECGFSDVVMKTK